jgi:hypothetical protein
MINKVILYAILLSLTFKSNSLKTNQTVCGFRSFGFMPSKLFSHSPDSEMALQVDLRLGFAEKVTLYAGGHGGIPSQISDGYSDSQDCFLEYGKAVIGYLLMTLYYLS